MNGYNIDYDLLMRLDDFYQDHKNEIHFMISSFNDLNNGKWERSGSVELPWLVHLIETKYWIPISKEEADELFRNNPNY